MRLKNKAMIYDLFYNDPCDMGIKLESECVVGGAITFRMNGKLGDEKLYTYIVGVMSYYEAEEINGGSLNDAVDYIWRERKRFIDTRSEA